MVRRRLREIAPPGQLNRWALVRHPRMAEFIDRIILLELLDRWESGVLDEPRLHMEAESLWDAGDQWPTYPNEDPRSIAIDVLSNLETMNVGFIGRQDIPAIRAFLETPEGQELSGWKTWESYWATVDFTEREKALGADGYYRQT
jgi:hypothetical protein